MGRTSVIWWYDGITFSAITVLPQQQKFKMKVQPQNLEPLTSRLGGRLNSTHWISKSNLKNLVSPSSIATRNKAVGIRSVWLPVMRFPKHWHSNALLVTAVFRIVLAAKSWWRKGSPLTEPNGLSSRKTMKENLLKLKMWMALKCY